MKIHLGNKITRGKSQVKRKEEESGRQSATSGLSRLLILCFAEKKKKKLLILKWKTRWRKTILILFLICNPPYLFHLKSEMKYVGMYDS